MARDAEVLQEQVACEYIAERKVLDCLTVFDCSGCCLFVGGGFEVQVQRYHAAFDVSVFYNHVVTFDPASRWALIQ